MSEQSPAAPRDDAATIAAAAIIAGCLTTIAHEAFGHGGACLVSGGRIELLTSVYFECAPRAWPIALAGPLGNLAWAVIAGFAASRLSDGVARLVLALSAVFSFFWEGGYLLYAMALGEGDVMIALRGALGEPGLGLRMLGFSAGLALYVIGARVGAMALRPFATEVGRKRRLVFIAWLAAGLASAAAALLYAPRRGDALLHGALEIGAAAAPLVFLRIAPPRHGAAPLARQPFWIALALIAFAAFALTLGRGLPAN